MRKPRFTWFLAAACAGLAAIHCGAQTRIMPFGDSVTADGATPESSYRYWLWTELQAAGFNNIQFIGSQYGVADGTPANTDFDQHYEGGDGWETSDGVYNLNWIAAENPDIVLLDLGANDVEDQNIDLGTTTTNLETIMQGFYAVNPNVVILLADPTPWVIDNATTPQSYQLEKSQMSKLKGAISRAAAAEKAAGVRVTLVNLWAGFNPRKDTKDGTHPNVSGEQKIAKKFFTPLSATLRRYF